MEADLYITVNHDNITINIDIGEEDIFTKVHDVTDWNEDDLNAAIIHINGTANALTSKGANVKYKFCCEDQSDVNLIEKVNEVVRMLGVDAVVKVQRLN